MARGSQTVYVPSRSAFCDIVPDYSLQTLGASESSYFNALPRLPTWLKSGVLAGKLMNLYILVLKPSTVCFVVCLWCGTRSSVFEWKSSLQSKIYFPSWMCLHLSWFFPQSSQVSESLPLKSPPPQPDSSTCMHHSRMVLDEWWAVLCRGFCQT